MNNETTVPQPTVLLENKPPESKLWLWLLLGVMVVSVGGLFYYFSSQSKVVSNNENSATDSKVEEVVDDPNTITVWAWNTAAKALVTLVPKFNEVYPNIKVNVVEIPYNEANLRFRASISTGVGFPDVMDVEGPVTAGYIDNGSLLDISEVAMKYKDSFVPYKWSEVARGNRVYALPWDTAPVGMFYRKDIFAAAGVDPLSIKTWNDFIAAGKKITKVPNQYLTLMSRKSDVSDIFQTLLCQFGGSEYDNKGNITFNSKQGIQTVNLMKKILDSGVGADIGWWTPEFYSGIKSGQIASLTTGVWMGGQIKETAPDQSGKWGVIQIPATVPGGVRSAVRGGSNLAITAKSKKADMSWKFIEFALTNKESQLSMYKEFSIFPALKEVYSDPAFDEPNEYFGNQNISKLFIESQNKIPTEYYYGPYSIEINQIISNEVVLAINGEKTAAQALADAETQANKILKK